MGWGLIKIAGCVAMLCLLGGAGLYVVTADRDRRPEPMRINELAGVRLGMSPTDVTVALGKPSAAAKLESDGGGRAHLTYVYTKEHNQDYALNITFHGADGFSLHAAVICEKGAFSDLLGIDKFSQEQDVLRLLGQPSHSSVRSDGLEKAISYDAWNASFKIARGHVVALCIHLGNFIAYDHEIPTRRQAVLRPAT